MFGNRNKSLDRGLESDIQKVTQQLSHAIQDVTLTSATARAVLEEARHKVAPTLTSLQAAANSVQRTLDKAEPKFNSILDRTTRLQTILQVILVLLGIFILIMIWKKTRTG